jgi:hypothetical protein
VVTRACKFLLFSRAAAMPPDRPRGATVVDACRSLLIARSYPPPCGEGRRRERSERRRGGGGRGWPLCASRYCLLDPHPGHLGNRLRRPTLPESSIRRERSPRRIGRFWGRVRERAAPVRRSQPRAIVNRCRSLLIAHSRRCAAARPATPPDFALRAQSGRRRDRSASAIVLPCKFLFFPAAGAPPDRAGAFTPPRSSAAEILGSCLRAGSAGPNGDRNLPTPQPPTPLWGLARALRILLGRALGRTFGGREATATVGPTDPTHRGVANGF